MYRGVRGKGARLSTSLLYATLISLIACTSLPLDSNAGRVTFGTALDTSSFDLSGEGMSFPTGRDVAYRAGLSRAIEGEQIRLVGTLNGTTVVNDTHDVAGAGVIYGGTIPGAYLYEPGTFELRLLDFGNNELSSGSFTVVP